MPQQIYSYSPTTPTSPLAYSTSPVPIPITNQRRVNPSRSNHAHSSSGSIGFTDTPFMTAGFRSVRRDSLQGQTGTLVGSYEVPSNYNFVIVLLNLII